MVSVERAFREDDIARAVIDTVTQEPGVDQDAVVTFIAQRLQADKEEVWDVISWLTTEHQIIRRFGRGARRLYPYQEGFAIKRIFPRGSPEHS